MNFNVRKSLLQDFCTLFFINFVFSIIFVFETKYLVYNNMLLYYQAMVLERRLLRKWFYFTNQRIFLMLALGKMTRLQFGRME